MFSPNVSKVFETFILILLETRMNIFVQNKMDEKQKHLTLLDVFVKDDPK